MFNSAPAPHDPPANDDAPDPSVAAAAWRLGLLKELAEIGMELARALKPGAAGVESPTSDKAPAKGRDPAEVFAPLSRAVRLTLALHAKFDQELRDLKSGIVRVRWVDEMEAENQAIKRAETAHLTRQYQIGHLVQSVAEDQCQDREAFDTLIEALYERLTEDEAYDRFGDQPTREIVESLCKDLGLEPDWSRWDGEGWIQDGPPPLRPRTSPFNMPSAKPLLDDDGEPLLEMPWPLPTGHDLE
jgi:hypothetical protein